MTEQKSTDSTIEKSMDSISKSTNEVPGGDVSQMNQSVESNTAIGKVLDMFTQSEQASDYVPNRLKGKRKKKKRKGQSDNQ